MRSNVPLSPIHGERFPSSSKALRTPEQSERRQLLPLLPRRSGLGRGGRLLPVVLRFMARERACPPRARSQCVTAKMIAPGQGPRPTEFCRPRALTRRDLLRRPQLALHSKARKSFPSPPAEGGEGWGEEDRSSCGWPVRQQLDAPLPSPLPARSSRGEGVGNVAYPAASSVWPS